MEKVLDISAITVDAGTQIRVEIDHDVVAEYAEAAKAKQKFPACVAYTDGATTWLVDGFHRYWAARKCGCKKLRCEIITGDLRAAILWACGANRYHGLRRCSADKRQAVMTLLKDKEWAAKSDRWIAEQAGVSHTFVAEIRNELAPPTREPAATRTGRDGKRYQGGNAATSKAADSAGEAAPDNVGRSIAHPHVRQAFESDGVFADLMARIEAVRRDALALAETDAGRHLLAQAIKSDLTNAWHGIKHGRPHAVCVYCAGRATDCKACLETGFLPKEKYDLAPKELRRA